MSQRDELFEEIRHAQRLTGKKVSRMKVGGGAAIAGTGLDPRRDLKKVRNYNTKQMESYLAQLNKFRLRSSGYVMGAQGRVIARSLFLEYKRKERAYNKRAQGEWERVKDRTSPGTAGLTNEQIDAIRKRKLPGTPRGKYRASDPILREARHIMGDAGIRKMIRNMDKMLASDRAEKDAKQSRKVMRKMLKGSDSATKAIRKKIARLTNSQLNYAMQYSDLMMMVEARYSGKGVAGSGRKDWKAQEYDNNENSIHAILDEMVK